MRTQIQLGEQMPLDALRQRLDQADALIGGLALASPADTERLLPLLSDIQVSYDELSRRGVDLRAETNHLDTIHQAMRRKAGLVVRLLRPGGGLAARREQHRPPAEHWWWFLDAYVHEQQQRMVRNALRTLALVVVVFVALGAVYVAFFQPPYNVRVKMDALAAARTQAEAGNDSGALAKIDAGLAIVPDDEELLLWRGALLRRLGRRPEADAALAAARAKYPDAISYFLNSIPVYMQTGDTQSAQADMTEALRLAPDDERVQLTYGGLLEAQGKRQEALQTYSLAAELAQQHGNTQIEALIKVRMGMLMQSAPIFPGQATATP